MQTNFKDYLNAVSGGLANLPVFASAVAEFNNKRAADLQAFFADDITIEDDDALSSDPTQPSLPQGGYTFSTEVSVGEFESSGPRDFITIPFVGIDHITKESVAQVIALSKAKYKELVNKDILGQTKVDIPGGGVMIIDDDAILSNVDDIYSNCVLQAEIYSTIAKQKLSSMPDVTELTVKLNNRLSDSQIQSLLPVLQSINSMNRVSEVFGLSGADDLQPDEFGRFDYDDYTSVNAFSSAVVRLGDNVSGIFKAAFAGVKTISCALAAIGVALKNLIEWLVSKLFRQLVVDYTLNEDSNSLCLDVPLASFEFNTLQDFAKLFPAENGMLLNLQDVTKYGIGVFDNRQDVTGSVYNDLVAWGLPTDDWKTLTVHTLGRYFEHSETNLLITATVHGIVVLAKNRDTGVFHLHYYGSGYYLDNMTKVVDGELQDIDIRLSQLFLDSDTFTNEDVISVITHMDSGRQMVDCMRMFYSLKNKPGDPYRQSVESYGAACLRSNWTDHTPGELIANIYNKNVNANTFSIPDNVLNSPELLATSLIIPVLLSQHRLFEGWKDLSANEVLWQFTNVGLQNVNIDAPDANSHVGLDFSDVFLPYLTNGSFDYWIHPQTDDERTDEAFTVLIGALIAAAAVFTVRKFLKFKKNLKIKRAELVGKIRAAENNLAADPTNPANIKAFLKSKRKLKRVDFISGIFSKGTKPGNSPESIDDNDIILSAIGVQ